MPASLVRSRTTAALATILGWSRPSLELQIEHGMPAPFSRAPVIAQPMLSVAKSLDEACNEVQIATGKIRRGPSSPRTVP
jgi:hypothetical protein